MKTFTGFYDKGNREIHLGDQVYGPYLATVVLKDGKYNLDSEDGEWYYKQQNIEWNKLIVIKSNDTN